ncbi:DUF808 family protein, partial [Kaistella sp.]|uniref:DUF808 family protein n=1 Tax=Kaistella sp. TaxID=2782235 RepID=UPI002F950B1A
IVPIAFLLQVVYPPAIKFILILGGLYLAYEGVEKVIEYFFHRQKKGQEVMKEVEEPSMDGEVAEAAKVKSAISTDFILSIEIVIIALGTVLNQSLLIQIITVSIVSIIATIGVYGIVALIVRMDDAGYKLMKRSNEKGFFNSLGEILVKALPIVIKILGVVGTIALILVSGGIFDHNIDTLHHFLPKVPVMAKQFLYGMVAGLIMVPLVLGGKKVYAMVKK